MGAGIPTLARLLAELRRRRVFRVAAVYAADSWLVVEATATTFTLLALESFCPRAVAALRCPPMAAR